MKEKTLQPSLRFPEFKNAGNWQEKKLGEVCEYRNGGSHEQNISIDGNYYLISLNSIDIEGNLKNEMKRLSYSDNSLIENDLVMVLSDVAHGDFLGLTDVIPNEKYVLNQRMAGLRIKQSTQCDVNFLKMFINSYQKYFKRKGQGSSQLNLSKPDVINFIINLPTIEEQQKIADCLSSLDTLISATDKKLKVLKKYKRGLMQSLFPQEGEKIPKLRFKEFEHCGAWEEKKLGEVCEFLKGRGVSKSDISKDGVHQCIHYGELYTTYNEVIYSIKSKTSMSKNYNCVYSLKNDVLMPSSDVTPKGLANASCLKLDNIILGSDIIIIRTNKNILNGEFLSRYICRNKLSILKLVSGSTVYHLYSSSLEKFSINFSSLGEQQKIADCLSSLDSLISATDKKLKALKKHKNGLMQRLFI